VVSFTTSCGSSTLPSAACAAASVANGGGLVSLGALVVPPVFGAGSTEYGCLPPGAISNRFGLVALAVYCAAALKFGPG
jgi:hypothetical protein